jgi:hypothetical protein
MLVRLDGGSQALLELKLQRRLAARRFGDRMGLPFNAVGSPSGNSGSAADAEWMSVSPGYFAVLRIPIIRDRGFHEQDGKGAPGN